MTSFQVTVILVAPNKGLGGYHQKNRQTSSKPEQLYFCFFFAHVDYISVVVVCVLLTHFCFDVRLFSQVFFSRTAS